MSQELNVVLGSVGQVVVEGDRQLRSYAVAKTSNDPANANSAASGSDNPFWEARDGTPPGVAS